ncbi:MAG: hypothetical protein JKP92_09160 [Alphaproteobacteria bacterium]|jgi:hypothetical protein|nr:hypothetical protein [Alphaproteobacteria bacterium]
MEPHRNREEAVNTQLAIALSKMGIAADAETIRVHGKHRPDVHFEMNGLRVIVEAKFADHPQAREVVLNDARVRVRAGLAHMCVAAVYPEALRTAHTNTIEDTLRASRLAYCVLSEIDESPQWLEGGPADVLSTLRRTQEAMAQDDVVARVAQSLRVQLEGVADLWKERQGDCERLSELLGIHPPDKENAETAQRRRGTAARVAALVLANAFIFQEQLAQGDGRIAPLSKLAKEADILAATEANWHWIWTEINYVPIFQLGERVLAELPRSPHTLRAIAALLAEAQSICAQQTALRHDLMGRIYHWLLHEAKYLGTYYTSVMAATILLKLALEAPWKTDFGDPVELSSFKVADLACGTGTLLMAAAQALSDAHIQARADTGRRLTPVDLQTLHRTLMENTLHGYDVLPTAVHLTASTLAMLAPAVAFLRMNLWVMPMGAGRKKKGALGKEEARLGSLDFLENPTPPTQFSLDYSQMESVRTSTAARVETNAHLPQMDLCVMNPPFVRSVGGNLLFGSLADKERNALQKELKEQVTRVQGANITAGLGSVFVALADRNLKPGGRLAFVLPSALVSGEAWAPTRELLARKYHLETVVISHDSERPNFSENTDLSELLFVARRRVNGEKAGPTTFINLWRVPPTVHGALDFVGRVHYYAKEPVMVEGQGITTITNHWGKAAEIVRVPPAQGTEPWVGGLFAQTELLRTFWFLREGAARIPGHKESTPLPLTRLDSLGALGYDQRDIHDAFEVSYDDWSPYPAFWGHDAKRVVTIAQMPNAQLLARMAPAPGREKIKDAHQLWKKAGHILLAERLWGPTHKVLAVRFAKKVLGNTWWAFAPKDLTEKQEKALVLWLNSSLSMLLYFGARVVTRSAWCKMKKPAWTKMPVLDVRTLPTRTLTVLAKAYDALADEALLPLGRMDACPTRAAIDAALAKALGLPDLAPIRELLAREPGLSARSIGVRAGQA